VDFAEDRYKQLLLDSETWAEASANSERCGNMNQAIIDCQQAIG